MAVAQEEFRSLFAHKPLPSVERITSWIQQQSDQLQRMKDTAVSDAEQSMDIGDTSEVQTLIAKLGEMKQRFRTEILKAKVWEGLANAQPDQHIDTDTDTTELTDSKLKNKELKSRVKQEQTAVENVIKEAAAAFDKAQKEIETAIETAADMERETVIHNENRPPPLEPLSPGPTLEDMQHMLNEEREAAVTQEAAITAAEAKTARLHTQCELLEQRLAAQKAECKRREALLQKRSAATDLSDKLTRLSWLDEATSSLASMCGLRLLGRSEDTLHIEMTASVWPCPDPEQPPPGCPAVQHSQEVAVQLEAGSQRLHSLTLLPEATVPVEDLCQEACRCDAPLHVTIEMLARRLVSHWHRRAILEDTAAVYPLRSLGADEAGDDVVRAVLPNGMEAEVKLPGQWPCPGSTLQLLDLQAPLPGLSAADLLQELQQAGQLPGRDLRGLLDIVAAKTRLAFGDYIPTAPRPAGPQPLGPF